MDLAVKQRQQMIQLLELVMANDQIPDDALKDPLVVAEFIRLSQQKPDAVARLFRSSNRQVLGQLTQMDVLTEELVMSLHLAYPFKFYELGQWLRSISFDCMMFFLNACKANQMSHTDQLYQMARTSQRLVDGVYVESVTVEFSDLNTMVNYVIDQRFTIRQFQVMLHDHAPSQQLIADRISFIVDHYRLFSTSFTKQHIHLLRVIGVLLSNLTEPSAIMASVADVFDRLVDATSAEKTLKLLDTMPLHVVDFVLKRWVMGQKNDVVGVLSEQLPQFKLGMCRKIVRRHGLGVNY